MIEITEATKLSALMREYPWLVDEAVKMDSRFKVLKSPVGKLFLKNGFEIDYRDADVVMVKREL